MRAHEFGQMLLTIGVGREVIVTEDKLQYIAEDNTHMYQIDLRSARGAGETDSPRALPPPTLPHPPTPSIQGRFVIDSSLIAFLCDFCERDAPLSMQTVQDTGNTGNTGNNKDDTEVTASLCINSWYVWHGKWEEDISGLVAACDYTFYSIHVQVGLLWTLKPCALSVKKRKTELANAQSTWTVSVARNGPDSYEIQFNPWLLWQFVNRFGPHTSVELHYCVDRLIKVSYQELSLFITPVE